MLARSVSTLVTPHSGSPPAHSPCRGGPETVTEHISSFVSPATSGTHQRVSTVGLCVSVGSVRRRSCRKSAIGRPNFAQVRYIRLVYVSAFSSTVVPVLDAQICG